MLHIAIGTKNPAKVEAIKLGFRGIDANFTEVSVPSEVSSQPFSDEETIQGAVNRARNSLNEIKSDIGIGLEGGVVETEYGLFLCNWGAIVDRDNQPIIAGGAKIKLPNEIAKELNKGLELGDIMDDFTKQKDIRKNEGAIGIFTNGYVNRSEMFLHIVKLLVGQFSYNKRFYLN